MPQLGFVDLLLTNLLYPSHEWLVTLKDALKASVALKFRAENALKWQSLISILTTHKTHLPVSAKPLFHKGFCRNPRGSM